MEHGRADIIKKLKKSENMLMGVPWAEKNPWTAGLPSQWMPQRLEEMEGEIAREEGELLEGIGEVAEARGRLVFFIERDKRKTRCMADDSSSLHWASWLRSGRPISI